MSQESIAPQLPPLLLGFWSFIAPLVILLAPALHAATNLISADEIPPLAPPRAEIAPGFWEQYSTWVILGALLLLLLAGALVWVLLRPKPPPVMTPPALEAQQQLKSLSAQVESGEVLSHVSRILRHYFSLTFGLPPAERTTTEFSRALATLPQVGSDLSGSVNDFLRQCDERKFAPSPPQPPMGAIATASNLIERAEAARTDFASAANPPLVPSSNGR